MNEGGSGRRRVVVAVLALLLLLVVGGGAYVAVAPEPDAAPSSDAATESDAGRTASSTSRGALPERRRVDPPERVPRERPPDDDGVPGVEAPGARRSDAIFVAGHVVDDEARPIPGARVAAIGFWLNTCDDVAVPEGVRTGAEEWWSGGRGNVGTKGVEATTFARTARSGSDGEFRLGVPREARVWLCVRAPGYRPATLALGWLDLSRDDVPVVMEHAPAGSRVLLTLGGESLPQYEVELWPMALPEWMSRVDVATDEDGTMPADWLVFGRRYQIDLRTRDRSAPRDRWHVSACFDWEGGDVLELRELSKVNRRPRAEELLRQALELAERYPARPPPPIE